MTRFRTYKIFKKSRHGFGVFIDIWYMRTTVVSGKGVKTVEKTGPLICDASQLEGPLGYAEPGRWVGGARKGAA